MVSGHVNAGRGVDGLTEIAALLDLCNFLFCWSASASRVEGNSTGPTYAEDSLVRHRQPWEKSVKWARSGGVSSKRRPLKTCKHSMTRNLCLVCRRRCLAAGCSKASLHARHDQLLCLVGAPLVA